MATVPDLMSLLCLDPRSSLSAFGGNHRFILIEKDFTNSGDFVFNNLLQHFGRREPNTRILLVTLSHDWLNYSASAAKCGINLRKRQNGGNIEVLNVMGKFLENTIDDNHPPSDNYCDYILEQIKQFIDENQKNDTTETAGTAAGPVTLPLATTTTTRPLVVMIDDLSILLTLGADKSRVFRLIVDIDNLLRTRSQSLGAAGRLNHLIVQSMFTNIKAKQSHEPMDNHLNFLITNLENFCDLCLTLKPLETGHSTRVDGTIKMVDNRLPAQQAANDNRATTTMKLSLSMFPSSVAIDIGSKRAYFYKLSDRRVRLTTSALIF